MPVLTVLDALISLDGKSPTLISVAPGSDTGQAAVPVRVISQLGAGTGGGTASSVAINDGTTTTQKASVSAGGALKVDNSAVTQPVSGTFWQSTQPVSIATMPSTPVTGTFWQSTQPVSGPLTDTQLRATAVPVSGTFFQSTQPVSIAATVGVSGPLTDTQLRATAVPVSGTFFQGTQPVSIASMPSTPVTGTFWQSTQPVSIASTVAVSGPLTDTQIRASALPVSGTVTAAQATAANLNATVAQSGTWTVQPGNTANTTAWLVTGAALTKGTQGATGFSVQDFKDSGRNVTNYFMAAQIVSTAGEVLQSLTGYKGGIAVAATTTPAVVTSGKTYRVTSLVITYVAIATAGAIQVNLRANLSGVAALASPLVNSWLVGAPAAVAGVTQTAVIDFPDGLEFAAGTGLGLSVLGIGATGSAAIVGYAKLALNGFEY